MDTHLFKLRSKQALVWLTIDAAIDTVSKRWLRRDKLAALVWQASDSGTAMPGIG